MSDTGNGPRRAKSPSASGETPGPWLAILRKCFVATAVASAAAAAAAYFAAGPAAAGSVAAAAVLVVVFFGSSLLIGHVVGRRNPSAALGAFMVGYVVKVVGFGAVAFLVGAPAWLDKDWFMWSAVGTVVLWQAVELFAFSKVRLRIYNDPEPAADSGKAQAHGD